MPISYFYTYRSRLIKYFDVFSEYIRGYRLLDFSSLFQLGFLQFSCRFLKIPLIIFCLLLLLKKTSTRRCIRPSFKAKLSGTVRSNLLGRFPIFSSCYTCVVSLSKYYAIAPAGATRALSVLVIHFCDLSDN